MSYSRSMRLAPRRRRKRFDARRFLRALQRGGKRAFATWRRAPRTPRIAIAAAVLLLLWSVVNLAYHVARKPTELLLPVSGVMAKPPTATWRQYGALFERYSTATTPPELLAALAQIESAGDPVAHTYWRWRFSWNPLALYQPASSAVGMYQMTDPAFAEARHFCIRHHTVVAEGPWSCWFNALYTRVIPSHAIELTAIYLDRKVAGVIERSGRAPTAAQRQDLAALVHLCGAGPAEAYARHGFRLAVGERCGDHEAAVYLARANAAKRQFQRLAAEE